MNNEASSKVKQFLSGSITGLEHFAERNAAAYQSLLDNLKGHNLIPFWGAGFVAGLFPTWRALLEEIAKNWDVKLSSDENMSEEDITEQLIEEIGENILLAGLARIFSQPRGTLSPSRRRVREIFRTYHITTNYDKTIENLTTRDLSAIRALLPQQLEQNSELVSLIQQNRHCLIKLHGDIEDVQMGENIILSKASYDKYYPTTEPDTAVQQVLTSVLTSTPVIFIGCSLEQDRTLQIIERYAKLGCQFYALLPLPESTASADDAYMPVVREGQGRKDYLEREQFLAKHKITPIWYPYGEHDFVDGFLDLLHGEVVAPEAKPIERKKIDFLPDDAYKGRKQEMAELNQTLESGRIAWVSGGPGIGKSQLSRQVMARRQAENPARVYLTVDCQEVFSLDGLYLSCILACNPKADKEAVLKSGEPLRDQALRLCAEVENLGLFVDNFEMLNDAACKGAFSLEMIEFFCDLHAQGVELIMASRYADMQCKERSPSWARFRAQRDQIAVHPLSIEEARALFAYYVEGDLVCEGDDFEQLLSLMEGHPMSIMLVASLCEENMNWGFLLQDFKNNAGKETPMTTSCRRAWTLLQENEWARTLWGVLAWSTQPMPVSWIFDKGDEAQQWNAALARLKRLSLVSVQDDHVTMLMPIKQEFHKMEQAGEGETFDQARAAWWVERIAALATARFNPEMALHLSEVLQVMMKLLRLGDIENIARLSEKLGEYYEYDLVASEQFIAVLTTSADSSEGARLQAVARVVGGICCRSREEYGEAIRLFEEAGEFYASVDDRCYAYCLCLMGGGARMLYRYDEAMALYERAEQLYVQVEDNLGLAQTLSSMGDVARLRAQYDEAMRLYQRAEQLFVQEKDNIWLAATLCDMAVLARTCGQHDEAMLLFQRMDKLCDQEKDNLGLAYLMLLQGVNCSLGDQNNEALEYYDKAEDIYVAVGDRNGEAWTCKWKAKILSEIGREEEAEEYAARAEAIRREIGSCLP